MCCCQLASSSFAGARSDNVQTMKGFEQMLLFSCLRFEQKLVPQRHTHVTLHDQTQAQTSALLAWSREFCHFCFARHTDVYIHKMYMTVRHACARARGFASEFEHASTLPLLGPSRIL